VPAVLWMSRASATSLTLSALHEAVGRGIASDEAQIAELFAGGRCQHVYFDVGSNIGVQIRKLYEPRLFLHTPPAVKVFHRLFGPPPHCHVCTIGFEPNPRHARKLRELQEVYREAGAPVLILPVAAGVADSTAELSVPRAGSWASRHLDVSASTAVPSQGSNQSGLNALTSRVVVRTVDLDRIMRSVQAHLHHAHAPPQQILTSSRSDQEGAPGTLRHARSSSSRARVLAKFDIEGSELRVLPHLLLGQSLCTLDEVFIEWHEGLFGADALTEHAAALGRPPDARGVAAATRVVRELRATIEAAANRSADCRTRILDVDDESYYMDSRPLPKNGTSVCR